MNIKKILIAAVIVAIIYFIARSCQSSEQTSIEEPVTTEQVEPESEAPEEASTPEIQEVVDEPPSQPLSVQEDERLMLGIVHSVLDLESWMTSYVENRESDSRMAVYQNLDELGHIFVLEQVEIEDVDAFMEKGYGPQTFFFNAQYLNTEVGFEPYAIAATYDVEDFDKWKAVFESDDIVSKRLEAGLNVWGYAFSWVNAKKIYVLYTANTIETFRKHMARFDLEFLKEEATITTDIEVHFLKRLHMDQ